MLAGGVMEARVRLETVGLVEHGAEAGSYVLVRHDPEATGGCSVLRAGDPAFTGTVADDWVESRGDLEQYARECGWGVRWLDLQPPLRHQTTAGHCGRDARGVC